MTYNYFGLDRFIFGNDTNIYYSYKKRSTQRKRRKLNRQKNNRK